MASFYPIGTSRIADSTLQQRALSQFQFNRSELLRLQDQLSTGYRFNTPSEDPASAVRAIGLQRLIEQKDQAKVNLTNGQAYLTAADSSLSTVTDLISKINADTLTAIDASTTETDRKVLRTEIRNAIDELVRIGNSDYRGRPLFAGTRSEQTPFEMDGAYVAYHGNEKRLANYVDLGFLTETGLTGDEVFGAISSGVRGSVDLNPTLTEDTRLADLRGGAGIEPGSIRVSDGTSTSIVDLSSAETVGDVMRLLRENPPEGRELTVGLTATGLTLQLDATGGGSLIIRDYSGGTTAKELGILEEHGAGVSLKTGDDLNPRLGPTTRLSDLTADTMTGTGFDAASGLRITNRGTNYTITFEDAVTVEDVLNKLNFSEAGVLATINADGTGIDVRSTISGCDFSIGENGGTTAEQLGIRSFTSATQLSSLNYGSGVTASDGTDFEIRRKDGTVLSIDVNSANTVGDVLALINGNPANADHALVAQVAKVGNGIELLDNSTGTAPMTVTRTKGSAAWDLGLIAKGENSATGTSTVTATGTADQLVSRDAGALETKGVFNSLIRLYDALGTNNLQQIERASAMLNDDFERANFARSEIGARNQVMDVLANRLDTENVELQTSLSDERDVDFVEVISNLTARQTSVEASLRLIGQTMQLTLLNFV